MAGSSPEKAARLRALATQLRGFAAKTSLSLYQAKLLAAARDLERQAEQVAYIRRAR